MLGNPLNIEPKDGNLTNTNVVSILVEFNVSNQMLRGLTTENTAKYTQLVPIYFQR